MKCYRHPDSEAVAICCQCGRAVCPHCTLDNEGEKVLCSSTCNAAAEREAIIQQLIAQDALASLRSLKGAANLLKLIGSFCVLGAVGGLAIPFLVQNHVPQLDDLGSAVMIGGVGVCCFVGVRLLCPRIQNLERQLNDVEPQRRV